MPSVSPPKGGSGVSRPTAITEDSLMKALAGTSFFPPWWGGYEFRNASREILSGLEIR